MTELQNRGIQLFEETTLNIFNGHFWRDSMLHGGWLCGIYGKWPHSRRTHIYIIIGMVAGRSLKLPAAVLKQVHQMTVQTTNHELQILVKGVGKVCIFEAIRLHTIPHKWTDMLFVDQHCNTNCVCKRRRSTAISSNCNSPTISSFPKKKLSQSHPLNSPNLFVTFSGSFSVFFAKKTSTICNISREKHAAGEIWFLKLERRTPYEALSSSSHRFDSRPCLRLGSHQLLRCCTSVGLHNVVVVVAQDFYPCVVFACDAICFTGMTKGQKA